MAFSFEGTIAGALAALQGVAKEHWNSMAWYAEDQTRRLLDTGEMIALSRISGSLKTNDKRFNDLLFILARQARDFIRSRVQLAITALEAAFNAVTKVVWDALSGLLQGAGLPGLVLPKF